MSILSPYFTHHPSLRFSHISPWLGLTALGLLLSSEPNGKEISWQEFVTQVLESGEVERIIVTNRNVAKVHCLSSLPPSLPPSFLPSLLIFLLLLSYRVSRSRLPACTHPHFLPSPPSLPPSLLSLQVILRRPDRGGVSSVGGGGGVQGEGGGMWRDGGAAIGRDDAVSQDMFDSGK